MVSNAGGEVEYWVEYGTTTAYGSATPHVTLTLEVNEPTPVQADVAGLQRSTTYHFRFCAQDSQQSGGPGCGEDRTFVTRNLDCGDTITHDVVLSGDLSCPGSFEANGLNAGADGVDINLGGHDVAGPLAGLTPQAIPAAGLANGAGYDDVTVRNGSFSGWGAGISLNGASFNVIRNVVAGGADGILIRDGDGNAIRSTSMSIGRGGRGLWSRGSDHLVVTNSRGPVWVISGDYARIVGNEIPPSGEFVDCLRLDGNNNRVVENRIGGCRAGGIVLSAGSGNALIRNEASGSGPPRPEDSWNPDGILVERFTAGTVLRGNYVHDNADAGIHVQAPSASLGDNRAEDNWSLGIDAVAGVTDLGGNTASGNHHPLQCLNVFCAEGP